MKTVYVAGPLTELSPEKIESVKKFYTRLAELCEEVMGVRAFVPHEHYDPVLHKNFTPAQVDKAERDQVCNKTSLLLVCAIAPSWGGGIEVEMANTKGIPVIILCESEKLEQRKISRLLRGNPAVREIIAYSTETDVVKKLKSILNKYNPENSALQKTKMGA